MSVRPGFQLLDLLLALAYFKTPCSWQLTAGTPSL